MKNVAVWQLLDDVVSQELFQIIICTGYFRWLGLILAPDILEETFRHGHFIMWTFRHKDIGHHGDFGVRFWHMDVMALGHFDTSSMDTRIFWHMNVSVHVHFGTLQSNMDMSMCRISLF